MIDQQNFMTYLSKNYPYLFKVEERVRKIQDSTGNGNVFLTLRVTANKVDKISVAHEEEELIIKRVDNRI